MNVKLSFFASEVELHVGKRQFSDAACVFVGVYVFIVVPKGFSEFSSWNYGFVEFLSPASIGGSFFFIFLWVW